MNRALSLAALLLALSPAHAQDLGAIGDLFTPPEVTPPHGLVVEVTGDDGRPVGAGVSVALKAINGVQEGVTDPLGRVHFHVAPAGSATLTAQYQGVTFPFTLGLVSPGQMVEITVRGSGDPLQTLALDNPVTQFRLDEEGLVVHQEWRVLNLGGGAFDPTRLPEGALIIPGPPSAKSFGLSGEAMGVKAIEGGLHITRPILARQPLKLRTWALIPFGAETLEWRQTFPVKLRMATIVTGKGENAHKRYPLTLKTRGALGEVDARDDRWSVIHVKSGLEPGQPLVFALSGLPTKQPWGAIAALIIAALGILALTFGFRAPGDAARPREALEAERDRLLDALLRMERAKEMGRLSATKFTKERDAIITRLISLYEALG